MGSTEETFQQLVAQLDYPMFIATVAADNELAGCLIGVRHASSIHPPRVLAGTSDKNRTHRVAKGAVTMAIHLARPKLRLRRGRYGFSRILTAPSSFF